MTRLQNYCKQMLAIVAIMSGGLCAMSYENDMALKEITIAKLNYAVGEPVSIAITVENAGSANISSFDIDFTVNGVKVTEKAFNNKLLVAGRSETYKVEVQHGITAQTLGVELKATVATVNGIADENADNNSAAEIINVYNTIFDRNVVIEESTGTWCGWCVRGIVAMEAMYEKHPYDFIGIAVHHNDQLTVSEYDSNMGISNYPGCNLNRELTKLTVSPGDFGSYYSYAKAQGALGDVYTTANVSEDNSTLSLSTDAEFCYTGNDAYKLAYVLVEDKVSGYSQSNSYSGGDNGQMGGFEGLPEKVEMDLNDVARGIYPEYGGVTFTDSETIGTPITYTCDIEIPNSVQHKSNLSLVTLLIDATTGYIVNAHKCHLNLTDDDPDTPGGGGGAQPDAGDYKYVDLGLSVLWATGNMDSSDNNFGQVASEEMCGGYYGWADPTGLLTVADDSMYPQGSLPTEISGTDYDIAHIKWGGAWRMPTHQEFVELYDNCTTTSEVVNGVAGMRFTSVKNGGSIFLPYNGSRYESEVWGVGEYGSYWSGTLHNMSYDDTYYAYELDFDDWGVNIENVANRYEGMAIRPVCPPSGGVSVIKSDAAIEMTLYYNLNGVEVAEPTHGIYVKREIYSNGSVKFSKIAVR